MTDNYSKKKKHSKTIMIRTNFTNYLDFKNHHYFENEEEES